MKSPEMKLFKVPSIHMTDRNTGKTAVLEFTLKGKKSIAKVSRTSLIIQFHWRL